MVMAAVFLLPIFCAHPGFLYSYSRIRSKDLGWQLEGLKVYYKHMTTEPRRIGCITMTFQVPSFPKDQQHTTNGL